MKSAVKSYAEYPNLPEEGLDFMLRLAGHVPRVTLEELKRADAVKCNDKSTSKPTPKPRLRLGAYHHASCDRSLADSPLRLRQRWNGIYYWATARGGELHWWLLVKCNDSPKTGENGVSGSGTQTEASGTRSVEVV